MSIVENSAVPIVETINVFKDFGGVRAIDDLSLSFQTGELHCLIGPNGAGKSTLFKLLMGTERPTSGTIHLNGEDITKSQPFERARKGLGIKFQNMQVYQELSVFQNFFVPLRRHYKPIEMPEIVDGLLRRIHLAGLEGEVVKNLSHG